MSPFPLVFPYLTIVLHNTNFYPEEQRCAFMNVKITTLLASVCHYTNESQTYDHGNNPTNACKSNLVRCVSKPSMNKILSQ